MVFALKPNHPALSLFIIILLALLPAGCGKKDDAKAIRNLIQQGALLAEKHAVGDILDLAVPEFTASPGQHKTDDVKRILFAAFQYYGKFRIHYPQPSVAVNESSTNAQTVIYFMIVRQDYDFPDLEDLYPDPERWLEAASGKADLYQLKLDLVKTGKKWKVTHAELEGFKGYDF